MDLNRSCRTSTQSGAPTCESGCTGYGSQTCCPPLIVLASNQWLLRQSAEDQPEKLIESEFRFTESEFRFTERGCRISITLRRRPPAPLDLESA